MGLDYFRKLERRSRRKYKKMYGRAHRWDRSYYLIRRAILAIGGDFVLYDREDHLWLSYMEVKKGKRGRGVGTMVMRMICLYADIRGLRMGLHVASFGDPLKDMKNAELVLFYKGFGFYRWGGDMWRKPLCSCLKR